jgi:hypothetical protein
MSGDNGRPSFRSSMILYQRLNRLLDFHDGGDLRRKYCRKSGRFLKIASATVKILLTHVHELRHKL